MGTMKGIFKPKNPKKYKGNPCNIVYRSSWELKYMMELDRDPNVIEWGSEEQAIGYKSPIDNGLRMHRYFPDFVVKMRTKDGSIKTFMVEVKPDYQTRPPAIKTGKPTKSYINEVMTWGVNDAKWTAARAYCARKGYEFIIMTEYDLNIKKR